MDPKLEYIDHIHVFVADRKEPLDWYQNILGLKPLEKLMIETEVDKRCGTETGDIDFDCKFVQFRTRQDTPKSYYNKRTRIGTQWFPDMKVTFFMKHSTTLEPNRGDVVRHQQQ